MAKSVCVKSVGDPLTEAARTNRSVAGARMNWNAKSAEGDVCATIGAIRAAKKMSGRQIPLGIAWL